MALTAQALTTLDALKSELGITGTDDDSYLESTIERTSAALQSAIGRKVYYESGIVEYVRGGHTPFVVVARAPIVSITSIVLDDGDETYIYAADEYRAQSDDSGIVERLDGWWPSTADIVGVQPTHLPSTQRRTIKVTYTGGWVTPQQAADDATLTRDLPYDIEDAALALATLRYRMRGRDTGIQSRKNLSASVSFETGALAGTYPDAVQRVIASYGRIIIA